VRILVATLNSESTGGVETYVSALLPRLAGRGYEVTFGHQNSRPPAGARAIEFDGESVQLRDEAGLGLVARPDVILVEGRLDAALEARLLALAPVIFVAHDYAGACISGTKTWSFPSPVACQRTLGPGCLLHYFPHRCGGINPALTLRLFREERIRQAFILSAAKVVVGSEFLAREFRRSGAREGQVVVNPFFVQPPEQRRPRELPRSPMLAFLGRLTALKGVVTLLEAVARAGARLGEVRLLVAGEGPERQSLEAAGRRLRVKVDFLGWLDPKDRDAFLDAATLLVIPSVWPEPFGIVGLEAARLGVPAVAFPVGGIPEWLAESVNGELARRPADPDALADALVRALADADHYRALSAGALAVADRFGEERHMSLLTQTIEEVQRAASR
jgi:glycosyltransferase involved in cell wall biosynthesis